MPAGFGIRLNKKPPEITFRKKDKGGINYTSAVQNPKLDLEGGLGCGLAGLGTLVAGPWQAAMSRQCSTSTAT